MLLSGDEAVAQAAIDCGVALGTGYPGTPSTEILEHFAALGGKAQWSPNEKVALEVGVGAAFGKARALVTMKHVGLNVAADPLFTAAYTGVSGALVIVSADDPGMASSQNEQDNRHYAVAAGIPMLEPANSQDAYDFLIRAVQISERWHTPVLLRMTTRVCHSKTVVTRGPAVPAPPTAFERDIQSRVMIPAYARPAHRRLRAKLAELAQESEKTDLNTVVGESTELGIIANGVAYMHAREVAPQARFLKLGMSYPLPMQKIREFAASVKRCVVIEEGDPWLVEAIRAEGIAVEGKPEMYRFGELDVARVRRILAGDTSPEPAPPRGKPPALCQACPHRTAFTVFAKLDCIVAGDIGCYTLGVLPPFQAMDTCVCMGASITAGLGLRHVLPEKDARRVVSVIGDSTFVHSGITGLVEMVYNPPKTGHVVVILDNGTTAMTGLQEHPGTGRTLTHQPTGKISFEDLARSMGIRNVHVLDPARDAEGFEKLLAQYLASNELAVLIARRPCLLAAGKIKEYEQAAARGQSCEQCSG
ncbi:MAG TPA: thiamine pyrophosphate-dependent enzyme [Phycisphaerae bacterium]|nr:thiamine pyrophosphate-dependent enzyme [Phycisphaerae bacterium]